MSSYIDCQEIIKTARSRSGGKPLGCNTRLIDWGDSYAIRLHGTDVVRFYPDGSIVLDSGGWQTSTTKARMNEYLPSGWEIYQESGSWYLHHGSRQYVFTDGIKIGPRGGCSGKLRKKKTDKTTQAKRRAVLTYAADFVRELEAGKVPQPSSGDCWHCSMTVKGGKDDGKNLGEVTRDADHIKSHIDEKYYVPSLAVNACREFGVSQMALHWLNSCFANDSIQREGWSLSGVMQGQVKKAIGRYCLRQLGLPT